MFTVEVYDEGWQALDADVIWLSVQRGMGEGAELSALPALVEIVLTNHKGTYSPVDWRYFGRPRVGQAVRVLHGEEAVFSGLIMSISPAAGTFGARTVSLTCSDILERLQRLRVRLPGVTSIASGEALKRCTAAAFLTAVATGLVTISAQPAINDTVTVDGVTYTYKASPTQPYEIARGAAGDGSDAALALAAAINDDAQEASRYGANTPRHPTVTATVEPGGAGGSEVLTQDEEDVEEPAWSWVGLEYSGFDTLGSGRRYLAQRFTPGVTGQVSQVELYVRHLPYLFAAGQTISHRLRLEIYSENASGLPGVKLAEKQVSRAFTWPETGEWSGWETWEFDAPPTVYANTPYWVVLRPLKPSTDGFWFAAGWYAVSWRATDDPSAPWGISVYVAPTPGAWQALGHDASARMKVTVDEFSDSRVVLAANARGAWGNSVTLTKNGANISVSGVTLEGGEDYDNQDIAAGRVVLDLFAPVSEDSDALSIMQGVVESDYGRLYCDRHGVLTFQSRTWLAYRANSEPVATVDNHFLALGAEPAGERVANLVRVVYTPARTLASGVLARATSSLEVPGRGVQAGTSERWNSAEPVPNEQGVRTFNLNFLEPESGGRMTAALVYTPVPGVDYTVTDSADGGGYDYTFSPRLKLSVALTSTGAEVTLVSTAMGKLHVHGLQLRGIGQIFRDQQETIYQDTQSQDEYGIYEESLELPHALENTDVHAGAIASYLLARMAIPRVRVMQVTVDALEDTSWLTRDIGDAVIIRDSFLGETTVIIMGMQFTYDPNAPKLEMTLALYDTERRTYWQLGHETYGVLGQTTRLAL